jgi:integrase
MEQADSAVRREDYHYAVYRHKLLTADGSMYSRPFIVIKNRFGITIRFTSLHNYVGIFAGKVFAPLHSDAAAKLYHVCKMLNYILIERHPEFGADHVFEVRREYLEQYFRDYAETLQPNGEYRSAASVEHCVSAVVAFFMSLRRKFGRQMRLSESDLVIKKLGYACRYDALMKTSPAFQVRGVRKTTAIFRELPTKAFRILLNLAFRHTPDIAFAMCLQAFAGLRAGEVCNIRQEQSRRGGSMTLTLIGSDVRKVEIASKSDGVFAHATKLSQRQHSDSAANKAERWRKPNHLSHSGRLRALPICVG